MLTTMRLLLPIILCVASCAYAQTAPVVAQTVSETSVNFPLPMENPGFETGISNGLLPGWRMSQHAGVVAYAMTTDTGNAMEGKQSFRMERLREQVYGLIEQQAAVPAGLDGKPITYSAMLKTDSVGNDGWCLVVTFHGGTGEIIDQKRSLPMIGTHDWSRVVVDAILPAGTRTVAVGALLLDKGTGWIDDNRLSVEASAANGESAVVIEYYHAGLGHYFMTAFPDEIRVLDSGKIPGWVRTGESFLASAVQKSGLTEACRFFGPSFGSGSTHLYTLDAAECAATKNDPSWVFEAIAFHVQLPSPDGECASGKNRLYRFYNQGMGGAPNYRYTGSHAIRSQMIDREWVPKGYGVEGVIACTP